MIGNMYECKSLNFKGKNANNVYSSYAPKWSSWSKNGHFDPEMVENIVENDAINFSADHFPLIKHTFEGFSPHPP